MPKRWVIPDIHGCAKTLQALINDLIKPMRSDELYFLGDYVDRGPDSKGVIDFIRKLEQEKYNLVALKGNHEDFMIELYDGMHHAKSVWWYKFGNKKYNSWAEIGGKPTLQCFDAQNITDIPTDYIEWMRHLPLYVSLDDFILVHAGLNFKNEDPFEDQRAMLWLRDYEINAEKIGKRRLIHGHVPVNMELISMLVKSRGYKFIDLDNGPYLQGKDGFGNLVALELNSMEMAIQYNLDF
ncbi:MAG: metallophosphoesterase family protein [Bacteroidales bacterium]|nr:metallophosphoesterase family protein [Bacteroidales bacterium]